MKNMPFTISATCALAGTVLLVFTQAGCERKPEDKSAKTKVLEAGAEALQSEAPLDSIHAHVCGFHFYSGDMNRQVTAHHYCSHLGEDMRQCEHARIPWTGKSKTPIHTSYDQTH